MIWRLANAFKIGQPINVERVYGASYNTRSVIESLLAHTPEFYFCYPGRYETIAGRTTVKKGHKHIVWIPDEPHPSGRLLQREVNVIISEAPPIDALYDSIELPTMSNSDIDPDLQRTHSLIQASLYGIGKQLGFRTWIANNDRGIIFRGIRIAESEGVISNLANERLISAFTEAIRAALLIDCIWFKNGRLMPAVIEVENSTGVTSGLTRMKNLKDNFADFPTRYVIAAPDEDRDLVVREANKIQFKELKTKFFPYSAVRELYALCERRQIRGVTDELLDCYMEPMVTS